SSWPWTNVRANRRPAAERLNSRLETDVAGFCTWVLVLLLTMLAVASGLPACKTNNYVAATARGAVSSIDDPHTTNYSLSHVRCGRRAGAALPSPQLEAETRRVVRVFRFQS